jgi:hypothetical protein
VLERTLYNGLLSGVSLDGKSFFYPNPLESIGQHKRSPWFGVACCPGNITRFLASLPGYVYAQQGDRLYVNLYVASNAEVKMDNGQTVALVQDTKYPWDGRVRLTVSPKVPGRFTLYVRVPGWARDEPVPSDLYRYADNVKQPVALSAGGAAVPLQLDKGYARIDRDWKTGDVVELVLPMPVRRVAANAAVEADQGRVALQRGPLVYAAEWADNGGHVRNLMLADATPLTTEFKPDLLNGVQIVKAKATALTNDAKGQVQKKEQELTLIPYYSWANRGSGEMAVWLANRDSAVRPQPLPTLASRAKATASDSGQVAEPRIVQDQEEPRSSHDTSAGSFHWWPKKGTTEWVQYEFDKPSSVSAAEVYWLDDTGHGDVRVPATWRLLYKDGNDWKPVEAAAPGGVALDRYNRLTFKPVTTSALRLEVTAQPQWSVGLLEWKVE